MPDRRFFEEQARRRQARGVGREQEAQAAMAKLAATAEPKDRFGQVVGVGDLILYDPPAPNVFVVDDVVKTSALDPTAPPGVVTLKLRAEFQIHLNALQLPQNIIRVGFSTPEGPKVAVPQTGTTEVTIEKVTDEQDPPSDDDPEAVDGSRITLTD